MILSKPIKRIKPIKRYYEYNSADKTEPLNPVLWNVQAKWHTVCILNNSGLAYYPLAVRADL